MLAAVYLDGGIGQVRKLIHRLVLDQEQEKTAAGRDYKTALQELVQRENGQVLSYRLTGESGPDHAKVFAMEVLLNDGVIGSGQGRSKKEAEQAAAKAAVLTLEGRRHESQPEKHCHRRGAAGGAAGAAFLAQNPPGPWPRRQGRKSPAR